MYEDKIHLFHESKRIICSLVAIFVLVALIQLLVTSFNGKCILFFDIFSVCFSN